MRLKDRVAIITGAGSGIGRAGANLFAKEGARVVIADINEEAANNCVAEIVAGGGVAIPFRCDVSKEPDNVALVAAALAEFGVLNVVWANAGIPAPFYPIESYPVDLFDHMMAVNARGPWLLARASVAALKEAGGGSFIITSSLSGLKARPNHSGYQVSKGAAVMLARSLSREFAPFNIRVNGLCPVAADTPMLPAFLEGGDSEEKREALRAGIPMGRLATAEDVANAALFFASDDSRFITGVNLPVDGGVAA